MLKLKTIFDLDFKYIFTCRFLPFWLLGPAATSVFLWRTCGKCVLNLILSVVELAIQTFFERTGQEEKSDWEDVLSSTCSHILMRLATLRRSPG